VGEDGDKTIEGRLLDTLVSNTEALASLNATVSHHDAKFTEGQKSLREQSHGLSAKMENLDRSVSEMKLATERAEEARQKELKRIFDLLSEERKDRREAVTESRDGDKSERDLLREMIQEEMGERRDVRKDNRHLLKTASAEVWKAGGKYIVAAVVVLILAGVMKATGMSLADLIGLAGK